MGYKPQAFYDKRMETECESRGDFFVVSLASGEACKSRYKIRHVCGHEYEVAYSSFTSSIKPGCPACRRSKWARTFFKTVAKDKPACVYRVLSACGRYEKIGVSTWALEQRLIRLRAATPFEISPEIEVLFQGSSEQVVDFEQKALASKVSAGFSGFCGATEWCLTKNYLTCSIN